MKFVFAPDSFKGTLSAFDVVSILRKSAEKVFPDCVCVELPMADGGEGTMDIMNRISGGKDIYVNVKDPLFNDICAKYAALNKDTALIEMATASGLPLVPIDQRNPRFTSTYGTGQLILDAVQKGYKTIIIGLGGSATNDGGIGCMSALGIKFLDKYGHPVDPTGDCLANITDIDTSGLCPAISSVCFTVMCDVENPLLGPSGATYTFGPQKGASEKELVTLEEGMKNYADILVKKGFLDNAEHKGYGAAGGLAAGIAAFLKADFASGISTVLKYNNFRQLAENADLCITGEGRTDGQSAQGKVLYGVTKLCTELGIPVIALSGSVGNGYEKMLELGMKAIYVSKPEDKDTDYALTHARELLEAAADRLFKNIKAHS